MENAFNPKSSRLSGEMLDADLKTPMLGEDTTAVDTYYNGARDSRGLVN